MGVHNTLVIAGPTASGKTSMAVRLALELDAEILSADSRQVYRGMDIGTGKDLDEYTVDGRKVPFHLIDCADAQETFSLFNYMEHFNRVYEEVVARGRFPLICGGTGLYIEAALKQYVLSTVGADENFRSQMMELTKEELLVKLDNYPDIRSRTDISSKKRIVRSLEIARGEGESRVLAPLSQPVRPLVFVVMLDRDLLKKRIEVRLKERLNEGMIHEVELLKEQGVAYERLMMFGMEYRMIGRYLAGELSYEEMYEQLKNEIFRLAKRQRTWFRGMARRGIDYFPVTSIDEIRQIMKERWQ